MLTQLRLREVLHYDPDKGVFTWLQCKRHDRIGKAAGTVHKFGHGAFLKIQVDERIYYAGRLAWFYMTGQWPILVKAKNGDGLDIRWSNLCETTRQLSGLDRRVNANNQTGFKGVHRGQSPTKPFSAQIQVGGKVHFLGSFATAEEAHGAYMEARRRLHRPPPVRTKP
jgi:hypothetical protein